MEQGFFIVLGGLFLIFLCVASFAVKRVSSEDLAEEYLKVGLKELKNRVEEELRLIEVRERELKEKLEHFEALEEVVSERLGDPSKRYMLMRGDLKDAV
jgi:hypothetical protein